MNAWQKITLKHIAHIQPGIVTWIGVRPRRRGSMVILNSVQAIATQGVEGDHRMEKTPGSGRQVSIISEEYIQQIEHFTGQNKILPEQLRRNIVVKNINLALLKYQHFSIGEALFEATTLCHPCSRMNETVGHGTVAAMLGHGGICAKIIESGKIAIGDELKILMTTD